jgi:Fic family protein
MRLLLAKCSQDIALRDIDDLLSRGILRKDSAGGRSTNYSIVLRSSGPLI